MENKDSPEKEEKMSNEKEITVDDKIVQIIVDESSGISLDDFQSNDKKVLSVLNQDSDLADNQYTFNGLVRKLGIHQQSLSRALHRLEEAGLVQRTGSGYKLNKNLRSVLVKQARIDLENLSRKISKQHLQFVQILQLYIPTTVKVDDIVDKLVGKWFGNLRWIGLIEGDGGYVLQWANSDKFQINLKIVSRYATIESNATSDKDKAEAMIGAHRIFEQITKVLQKTDSEKNHKNNNFSYDQYN
ncbi:MAG: MarR family transcriptional regulator [Nitrosotalea sp.]